MTPENTPRPRIVEIELNKHDKRGRVRTHVRRKFTSGPKWKLYSTETTTASAVIPDPDLTPASDHDPLPASDHDPDPDPASDPPGANTTISPNNQHLFSAQTQQMMETHIRTKLGGYRRQDVAKERYDPANFVRLEHIRALVSRTEGQCYYCGCSLLFVYEHVRDPCQWSLDRINNSRGHTEDNVVLSCLSCNLRRGVMNASRFLSGTKMQFSKAPAAISSENV